MFRAVCTLNVDTNQAADSKNRWDTPQHIITDDQEDVEGGAEIWPGKDYSNARVHDFHTLNKPQEDMYDRTKVPRMPWCVCIVPYLIGCPISVGMTWVCKLLANLLAILLDISFKGMHPVLLTDTPTKADLSRWNYLLRIKVRSLFFLDWVSHGITESYSSYALFIASA